MRVRRFFVGCGVGRQRLFLSNYDKNFFDIQKFVFTFVAERRGPAESLQTLNAVQNDGTRTPAGCPVRNCGGLSQLSPQWFLRGSAFVKTAGFRPPGEAHLHKVRTGQLALFICGGWGRTHLRCGPPQMATQSVAKLTPVPQERCFADAQNDRESSSESEETFETTNESRE